jgi:hypothetical protein
MFSPVDHGTRVRLAALTKFRSLAQFPAESLKPKSATYHDLWVGILPSVSFLRNDSILWYNYNIIFGSESAVRLQHKNPTLHRIPNRWRQGLLALTTNAPDNMAIEIGYIRYSFPLPIIATTDAYEPCTYLRLGAAPYLPYYIEALTTAHLMLNAPTTLISTTTDPSTSRLKQLRRVDLQPDTPYPARVWLEAMGRGIRENKKRLE